MRFRTLGLVRGVELEEESKESHEQKGRTKSHSERGADPVRLPFPLSDLRCRFRRIPSCLSASERGRASRKVYAVAPVRNARLLRPPPPLFLFFFFPFFSSCSNSDSLAPYRELDGLGQCLGASGASRFRDGGMYREVRGRGEKRPRERRLFAGRRSRVAGRSPSRGSVRGKKVVATTVSQSEHQRSKRHVSVERVRGRG